MAKKKFQIGNNPLAWIKSTVDTTNTANTAGKIRVSSAERAESAASAASVDNVDNVERVEHVESFERINSIESVNSVDSVDSVESVGSVGSVEGVDSNDRVNILKQVKEGRISLEQAMTLIKSLYKYSENKQPGLKYFRVHWEEKEIPGQPGSWPGDTAAPMVIFDSQGDLLRLPVAQTGDKANIILVKPGKSYRECEDHTYEIDFHCREDYEQLIESICRSREIPARILYLSPKEGLIDHTEKLTGQLEQGIYALFYLSKALLDQKPVTPVQVLFVYHVLTGTAGQPAYAAVDGFCRSLSKENPKLIYKTVALYDLPPGASPLPAPVLAGLAKEFAAASPGNDVEICYQGVDGKRKVKTIKEFTVPGHAGTPALLVHGGAYLITGGLGGLGLIFAKHLAERMKAKLILVDRLQLTPGKQKQIEELERTGAEVMYIRADIANLQEVKELTAQAKQKFGHLNGIIHAAGAARDSFFIKKTKEEMETVLAPKVYGTVWLDEVTRQEPLDFFMLFSSIAAVFGNAGQCDYAYANSFMDHFAQYREQLRHAKERYGKTISINWPLWKEGGMKVDPRTQEWLEKKSGWVALETASGLKVFADALNLDIVQITVTVDKSANTSRVPNVPDVPGPLSVSSTQPTPLSQDKRRGKIEEDLVQLCSELLKVNARDIDIEDELSDYGLDSIMMITMLNRLESMYGNVVDANAPADNNTIKKLAAYLIDREIAGYNIDTPSINTPGIDTPSFGTANLSEKSATENLPKIRPAAVSKQPAPTKIAIIGMACRFPRSPGLESFWDNLKNGRNLITEVPADRWSIAEYFSPGKSAADKTYSRWGGFIDDIYSFDAAYFGISDNDARIMDIHHRHMLEISEELFCRAGYSREQIGNTPTAVYFGGGESPYVKKSTRGIPEQDKKHVIVNTIPNMMAARVSDFYNLKGQAQVIDTACSSSLVAIHQACLALKSGECRMAVAGGIEILPTPYPFIAFSKAEVLSDENIYYIFDERSKGFLLGEGAGAVLLKSYDDAVADGDNILGVITGSAVNNDGHTMGLTVPSLEGQQEVILQALEKSGAPADSISYLEAHGTGTLLGDPIEIKAATQAYRLFTQEKQFCAVGSVKSNMGHLMRAAGIAGFIKTILALLNKIIPPTLNCTKPHPRFKFPESPFYPVVQAKEWQPRAPYGIRRAAVSSFGFGGTNCHMIVEEFIPRGIYTKKRNPYPVTHFNRKRYYLGEGEETMGAVNTPGSPDAVDGIFLMQLLNDLQQKKINPDKALELINLGK